LRQAIQGKPIHFLHFVGGGNRRLAAHIPRLHPHCNIVQLALPEYVVGECYKSYIVNDEASLLSYFTECAFLKRFPKLQMSPGGDQLPSPWAFFLLRKSIFSSFVMMTLPHLGHM
jgi:hypothetical protein